MSAPKKPQRIRPVLFVWTENATMVPLPRFERLCDQQFAVGEEYALMPVENRSMASHGHYFAALGEGFKNLNEEDTKRFPTEEHLRAWALVQVGYCTETDIVCDSDREARALAVCVRKWNPYCVIKLSGPVVKVFEPESQSMAAMKKERFEASKADVLNLVASMARTTPAELKKNAGKSA